MQKRGQATVFIIIGIIIVAGVVITLWLKPILESKQVEALAVPEKAQTVQRHFQGCVEGLVEQGVNLLSVQGGYIELPTKTVENPYYPFSSSLNILPNSALRSAYWYYIAPNNVKKVNIPTIEQMENELADYIVSNLGKCMDNLELLEDYNVTVDEAASADVKIEDDNVNVILYLPVKIYLKDFQYGITKFYVEQKTKLGKMYNLAKDVTNAMIKDNFLEDRTIDILATDQSIPYSGTDFSCKPKIWTVDKVKDALKRALTVNIPLIKIKGTKFETDKDYYLWRALNRKYKDLSVNFRYSSNWPLKLEVEPAENGVLKALPLNAVSNEALAYLTALLCITDYNFVYDIMYPVLITVNDEKGNMFQVANFVVIDNNQPKENKEKMNFKTQHKEICEKAVTPITVYVLAPDPDGNLQPVSGADVRLKCITTTCALGKTAIKANDNEPKLKTRAPQCVNAQLIASKKNYHTGDELVSTIDTGTYSVVIEPYKTLRYEIKVIENGYERDLTDDDNVMVTIENEDKKFSTTLIEPTGKINLIAGNFQIRSMLITKTDNYEIKGKEVEHCYEMPKQSLLGLLGFTEQKCVTAEMDDITLDQAISGGARQYLTLTRGKLNNANKITFYVPAYDLPQTIDEMEDVYKKVDSLENAIEPLIE